jgi:hypothetical protein
LFRAKTEIDLGRSRERTIQDLNQEYTLFYTLDAAVERRRAAIGYLGGGSVPGRYLKCRTRNRLRACRCGFENGESMLFDRAGDEADGHRARTEFASGGDRRARPFKIYRCFFAMMYRLSDGRVRRSAVGCPAIGDANGAAGVQAYEREYE